MLSVPEHCSWDRICAPSNWWLTIFRLGFTQRMKLEPWGASGGQNVGEKASDMLWNVPSLFQLTHPKKHPPVGNG